MAEQKVNTKYKDRLFVWLFGKEERKQNILELYNALNHTHYTDVTKLEINTIDDAVYITMHNDVSFILGENMLGLWEEQSTFNPNMPVRGLMYLAQVYSRYIDKHKLNPYGETRFSLPAPQYIVFYLGGKDAPDELTLRLSDSFPRRETIDFTPCVEMTATMLNVNTGHNKQLLDGCRVLREYSLLVQRVRDYKGKTANAKEAIGRAVNDCIADNILAEELRANKAEVIGMLLSEYDEDKIRELFLAEGEKKGLAEGEKRGLAKGEKRGEKRGEVNELVGLVYDGLIPLATAETRAKEKHGIEKATFREMVKNYDPSKERVKVEA